MSVNRCSVQELKAILNEYPDRMNVVVIRHPDFGMNGHKEEYDGVEHHKVISCIESWDVYLATDELGEGEKVLLLSATPIEDDNKEQT